MKVHGWFRVQGPGLGITVLRLISRDLHSEDEPLKGVHEGDPYVKGNLI